MTFRARPVANRPHRSSRDGQSRRNFYLNVGFGLAVALAVVILVGVGVVRWYGEHLAAAATVNGSTITRDEYRDRAGIEVWRIRQQIARVEASVAAGRLTSAEATQRIQALQGQEQGLAALVLERLVDARLQAGLAVEEGITVGPEQIDARIVEESTTPEERHAWLIAVSPAIDEGRTEPTAAQKAAAKEIADKALADLAGGKAWEEVAKAASTDSTSATGGDLGWIDEDFTEDPAWVEAVFAADVDEPTAVIDGEDGTYRIGRVTEIAPAVVDPAWTEKLVDAGLKIETYRQVVQSEVVRQALEDKVVADVSKPGPQRRVVELAIQAPQTEPVEPAVKVRHILQSPKDDPGGAQALPADDPAWAEAEAAARKAYDTLKADPAKFDALARRESDEEPAKGEDGTGGKLPGYVEDNGQFVQEFADAVLKEGLQPGDVLEPFRTAFGWHVVQIMYRPPDVDQARRLRDQAIAGDDFAQLVRDYSDGAEAGRGGELGWIARGQLDNRQVKAIFDAQVGGYSEVVEVPDVGTFLYKVLEEQTRAPEPDQLETLQATAFENWYGEKKDAATITRDVLVGLGQ